MVTYRIEYRKPPEQKAEPPWHLYEIRGNCIGYQSNILLASGWSRAELEAVLKKHIEEDNEHATTYYNGAGDRIG